MNSFRSWVTHYRMVDRHKNPWGIFLRLPVYITLFYALWEHDLFLIFISMICEIALWHFIPPVNKTWEFIEKVISSELKWLNSPATPMKILSYALLLSGLPIVVLGLWFNNIYFTSIGFFLLILFNIIMNYIAKKNRDCRR